jgi:hypothetical protein
MKVSFGSERKWLYCEDPNALLIVQGNSWKNDANQFGMKHYNMVVVCVMDVILDWFLEAVGLERDRQLSENFSSFGEKAKRAGVEII